LWVATGLIAGVAVLLRPDSGLFALAIGITLVVSVLGRPGDVNPDAKREKLLYRSVRASYLGVVFFTSFLSGAGSLDYPQLSRVSSLSAACSRPRGDAGRIRAARLSSAVLRNLDRRQPIHCPVLWSLDTSSIKLDDIPDGAFDSAEEKQRVAALLEKYNHPPEEPGLFTDEADSKGAPAPSADQPEQKTEPANPKDESSPGDETDEG